MERPEADASRVEGTDQLDQVREAMPEPVESPDHERVVGTGHIERVCEARAFGQGAWS